MRWVLMMSVPILNNSVVKHDFLNIQIPGGDVIYKYRGAVFQSEERSTEQQETLRRPSLFLHDGDHCLLHASTYLFFIRHQVQPPQLGHSIWWRSKSLSSLLLKPRQRFQCELICKTGSLLSFSFPFTVFFSLIFFPSRKWINKSRVFVWSDQCVVMKAALQFSAKALLAGSRGICFILYFYETPYIFIGHHCWFFLGTLWPRYPPQIVPADWILVVYGFNTRPLMQFCAQYNREVAFVHIRGETTSTWCITWCRLHGSLTVAS